MTSLPLKTTVYTCPADVTAPIRIVQLTDLHDRTFGKENERLIAAVKAAAPDAIFMTGDMLDRGVDEFSVVTGLVSALSESVPVYFSYGNHELTWVSQHSTDLKAALEAAGATVLICDYLDTEIGGQSVRIGGYYNYFMQPHMLVKDSASVSREREWAQQFMDTSRQKILLSHIPTGWLDWNYIDKYDVGIVFAGHYHGGLIRIPLLDRGLYAPYAGFFPEYTRGLFVGEKSTCILSAGLSGEHGVPRIYNPPEICVVDLLPR